MADLRCEGITKHFAGRLVLDGVDLAVAAGRLTAILGRSGSGKTTLLRVICGFEGADRGRVLIAGEQVADAGRGLRPERRRIGYVPQEGALFPHLTIGDNIGFGLARAARRRGHASAELLALVGLPADTARRYPHQLSGGEQQRVALARALAPAPRLVLLDEPFSSLDAALRTETREAVAAALRQAGATAVLVTHDQAEALSMGAEVAVLRHGRMVQTATPDLLYRRPADLALARFVGDAVVLPGLAEGATVRCPLGTLPLAAGPREGAVTVMLRPEQIALVASGAGVAAARGCPARVTEVTFYGPDARLRLLLAADAAGATHEVTARAPGHLAPHVGETVTLAVTGEAVAFDAEA